MPRSQRTDRSESRSRSRSRSRSQSRSPSRRKLDSEGGSYSDRDTDYSDESFYSDDDRHKSPAKKGTNLTKKNVNKIYGKKGGRGGNVGGRQSKASKMTGGGNTHRENDNVAKRMLSARRLKINELRNQVESLSAQLKEVQQENKSLRRQNILSEKALDKYEYQENDMPSIIQRHNEEVRVLKEQLRKQKDKHAKTEGKLKDAQADLSKSQRQVKRLRDIVDKKDLGDRDEMSRKMTSMENELEDNRKRVSELERYTANLQKNHKHELGITRAKHKEDMKRMQDLQENYAKMETTLREKEKELDVRNIYAQRVMKPPHKLNSSVNSVRSTPVSSQRSVPLSPGRERKNSDKRERRREKPEPKPFVYERKAPENLPSVSSPVRDVPNKEPSALERQPAFLTQSPSETGLKPKEDSRKAEADDDDNWMAQRESIKLEAEKMKRDAESKISEERKQRDELERKRREEEEEEQSRRDEEVAKLLREDDERRQREEKQRKEREQHERKEREEYEERMRKARDDSQRMVSDKAEQDRQKQKALLLAKMKAIDDGKTKSDLEASPTHRKYSFTKPVENLHNGYPAKEEYKFSSSRRRSRDSDSDNGGYKPSFSGNEKKGRAKPSFLNGNDSDDSPKHKAKNNPKKTNLMADLFGGDSKSDNNKKDDIFGDFKPSRPTERRRGQEPSGPGLFEINDSNSRPGSGQMLPRRNRQFPSTIHNRPTINAVDDFDDDLEEMVL